MRVNFQTSLIVVIAALACSVSVGAHPNHVSTTEVEWNAESQRFEVAMRLRIADLEDAISAKIKSRFRLEESVRQHPDGSPHLQSYLRETFSLTFTGDKLCRLHWIGCELELHDAWIYFEAESVGNAAGKSVRQAEPQKIKTWDSLMQRSPVAIDHPVIHVQNKSLLEVQKEQVNVVTISYEGTKTTHTIDNTQQAAPEKT